MRRLVLFTTLTLALGGCGSGQGAGATDSGVRGRVFRGPLCPVATLENPCPDEPYATTVHVLSADGEVVAQVHSGADGRFLVRLQPGLYNLDTERGKPTYVTVRPHSFAQATVSYDTGIR